MASTSDHAFRVAETARILRIGLARRDADPTRQDTEPAQARRGKAS